MYSLNSTYYKTKKPAKPDVTNTYIYICKQKILYIYTIYIYTATKWTSIESLYDLLFDQWKHPCASMVRCPGSFVHPALAVCGSQTTQG